MTVHTAQFPGAPDQVHAARTFVAELLAGDPRAHLVQLAVSEVVTNALRHSRSGRKGGTIALALDAQTDVVRVEVTDNGGRNLPHVQHATATDQNGRGLEILDAIAVAWGHHSFPRHRATCVWFEVAR